ncbi:MAG: nitrilase-related carbon-nitrogen hydrolase [Bacteroidales bacterium]
MIITLCSTDIAWENKAENFKRLDSLLDSLNYKSDVIVFPEMFSTGFTMDVSLAEDINGESFKWLLGAAAKYKIAIIASFPFKEKNGEEENIYNRAFFVCPNGKYFYYDKRHLFRMARENGFYTFGNKHTIIEYRGVRFSLNICYDLRFPVWSRNIGLKYDVLINVANFPVSRVPIVEPLVRARAIENMAYVAFVNRVGHDDECEYIPSSFFADYKGNNVGEDITLSNNNVIQIIKGEINIEKLRTFRAAFPAWMDADDFTITL